MISGMPFSDIAVDPVHSREFEYRIFGPPGTGKTTRLAKHIEKAVATYGAEKVLVTSFTRSSARELIGRNLPIASGQVGTLHSHCWHALGQPAIAETCPEEWNRHNRSRAITPIKRNGAIHGEHHAEDDRASVGDSLLREMNRLRGSLSPRCGWPLEVRDFAERWEAHKRSSGLLDFCDLIETAGRDIAVAPGLPAIIFADEAQDLNPLQLGLLRKWGAGAGSLVLAGDDDQAIYSFAGANPVALLQPLIPEHHVSFLEQSFRVPASVHAFANRLIRSVSKRQEKIYRSRSDAGAVHRLSATYKTPEYGILKSAL